MSRLIEADEIKKREKDVVLANGAKHRCFDTTMLSEIPTVDAVPKADYDYLLKRFKHLIQSDYIKSFDAWDSGKNDYVLDIRDAGSVRQGHIVYRERYRIHYGKYTGFDEKGEEHTITVCEDYGSGKEPYCSECGSQLAESSLNYCPNCGAKMDEVEENA